MNAEVDEEFNTPTPTNVPELEPVDGDGEDTSATLDETHKPDHQANLQPHEPPEEPDDADVSVEAEVKMDTCMERSTVNIVSETSFVEISQSA